MKEKKISTHVRLERLCPFDTTKKREHLNLKREHTELWNNCLAFKLEPFVLRLCSPIPNNTENGCGILYCLQN